MGADDGGPIATVRRIAVHGLEADDVIDVPARMWGSVLRSVRSERLTGLATAAAEAGRVHLSVEQAEELRRAHREAMALTLSLERLLLELVPRFRRAGIPIVVLKGPALAHTVYPDPAWRPFSDLDLMVRTTDWREACAVLEGAGLRRNLPEPRRGFDERFGKAAVHTTASGLSVDLHRALVLGPFGLWARPDELMESTVPFVLAGIELRRLDDTNALLHACLHASLGWRQPLLLPIRDLHQATSLGSVDWDVFASRAARWRMGSVVRHAFELTTTVLGATPMVPARAREAWPTPSRAERRALRAYVTARRAHGGTIRSTMRAVPGLRSKASLIRDLMFPDPAFLAAREANEGPPSYIRRWATPIRWLLRRSP